MQINQATFDKIFAKFGVNITVSTLSSKFIAN